MLMSRIILIMLVLNMAVTAAGTYFSYVSFTSGSGGGLAAAFSVKSAKKEIPKDYIFFPIEKIIVSLAEAGREHYFVLDLVLQADSKTEVESLQKIDPMVRSTVVSRLSSLPFATLRAMPISEVQAKLDEALREDFAEKKLAIPFASVLVSKMIVQ